MRRLALLALLALAALPAAAGAQDPGPLFPGRSFGDPEAPPRPLSGPTPPGAPRAAPAWRASPAARPPSGLTRAVSDGTTFVGTPSSLAETTMAHGAQA